MAYTPQAPSAVGHVVAITKSDTTVYSPPLTWLWVGGVGNVALIAANDTAAVTFTAVAAGTLLQMVAISKVMSTNTTATLMVGGY